MIFLHQPADPFDSIDPVWELRNCDYSDTGIDIQDCRSYGGGFAVNEHGGEGSDLWMRTVATVRTLAAAKKIALEVAQKRTAQR